MQDNIGVGLIVGAVTGSSIYIWNSTSFSNEQKTLLLICIIFPPAQWIGILVVSIYNKNRISNSVEKINERKIEQVKTNLNSSIENLSKLKEKGIITDVEYDEKVGKIKAEKKQSEIKNSTEFIQLKSLFDNGILTKEEFENKIMLISNNSEKEAQDVKKSTFNYEEMKSKILGTYNVGNQEITFKENGVFVTKTATSQSEGKWLLLNSKRIQINIGKISTTFENFEQVDDNTLKYINGKTHFKATKKI